MKFTNEQIEQGLDKIFDNLLQTKDVEASESMEITPDEGYAGIKKVNLTVKGGGGGGSNIVYYPYPEHDSSAIDLTLKALCGFSAAVKATVSGDGMTITSVFSPSLLADLTFYGNEVNILAFAICFDISCSYIIGGITGVKSISELLYAFASEYSQGKPEQVIANLPTLTEEEFYNLNA